jgi:hypothetical protein
MNYQKAYDSLILKALKRGLTKKELSFQTEKHHIVPRCLGGKDEKTNYVLLTPKEHYVAHHLLYKIYPNDNGIFLAYRMMSIMDSHFSNRGKFCISAKEYQHIKEKFIRSRLGTKHSPETLAKMRKPRRFMENMRKPKTLTDKLKAEHERRISIGFFKGENNACYGTHFEWYNDGKRNFRITGEPPVGLTKGKIQKKTIRSTYIYNGIEFHSEKEIYKYLNSNLTFSTWKRKNYELLKNSKL